MRIDGFLQILRRTHVRLRQYPEYRKLCLHASRIRLVPALAIATSLVIVLGVVTDLMKSDSPEPSTAAVPDVDIAEVQKDLEVTPGISVDSVSSPPQDEYAFLPPPRDWADSLPIPPWVLKPSTGFTRRRRYSPPSNSSGTSVTSPRIVLSDSVPLMLVIRSQGSRLLVDDIGQGDRPASATALRSLGTLRLLGSCSEQLLVEGHTSLGGNYVRVRARLAGTSGDWLFHMSATTADCDRFSASFISRKPPTNAQRDRVSRTLLAVSGEMIPDDLRFHSSDLKDFALGPSQPDGSRLVWGVMRQSGGTQLAPPPPTPQLAFVIRFDKENRSQVLWTWPTSEPGAKLGLAGVRLGKENESPVAYFVFRNSDNVTLLRVGSDPDGTWRTLEERSLHPIN